MGISHQLIAQVQSMGFESWLDQQMSMPVWETHWDWLIDQGFGQAKYKATESGIDSSQWRKLILAPDTLRQRVCLALSEITVASLNGFLGLPWMSFSAAAYLDILQANAFGNFRTLLEKLTLSVPMGEYLTYRGSERMNSETGVIPDENFARELLQLFTIGLVQLNIDGTPLLREGAIQETFTLKDVEGLARVFTGWDYDQDASISDYPDYKRRPMKQVGSRHESGSKIFLGTTIRPGSDGLSSVKIALDTIFAHANVAPFISRQLIQRLVCSNPSPQYIARVATVFNDDGHGSKGNLAAVIKAILLDEEARSAPAASAGKLREPILRLTAWARAFEAASPSGLWKIGDVSDPANGLGQSPLRAPTVFNFFQPDFLAPANAGRARLVAPELQIANEASVTGYINFTQNLISGHVGDVRTDYTPLLPLAADAAALLDEINLLLAAGQLSQDTIRRIKLPLETVPADSDASRRNRIHIALLLTMASPEFIVQK